MLFWGELKTIEVQGRKYNGCEGGFLVLVFCLFFGRLVFISQETTIRSTPISNLFRENLRRGNSGFGAV